MTGLPGDADVIALAVTGGLLIAMCAVLLVDWQRLRRAVIRARIPRSGSLREARAWRCVASHPDNADLTETCRQIVLLHREETSR